MIIRIFSTVLLCLFGFTFVCSAIEEPSISATSAIIIDGDTKGVIYQKNSEQSRSMASTTKIMTALLAIESGKLDCAVKITNPPNIEGTAIGFSSGDTVTLRTLCYGMLLESGNDAAILTAQYLAKSEKNFSVFMNNKAREIGMYNTNFVTASGLDDENHYTTAYDMALLGAYAVKNEIFAEICSTKTYKAHYENSNITRTYSNHNRLLDSCDGVFGIKTGFTKKSGRCLVTACRREGKLLVAVTLNAPDDWNDHKKLYEYGYSQYIQITPQVESVEHIDVIGSKKNTAKIKYDIRQITLLKDSDISYKVYIPENIYAPITENDVIGYIEFYAGESLVGHSDILSAENVPINNNAKEYKPSLFRRFVEYITEFFKT